MSFELIPERVAKLWQDRKLGATYRWGVVTSINPVRVRFDGDTDPFAGSPSSYNAGLVVGDRVHCLHYFRQVTIVGVGGGADNPRRFATKAQLDAWPAPDGATAYVENLDAPCIRVNGVWRGIPGQPVTSYAAALSLFPNPQIGDWALRTEGSTITKTMFTEEGWVNRISAPWTDVTPAAGLPTALRYRVRDGAFEIYARMNHQFSAGNIVIGNLPTIARPELLVTATARSGNDALSAYIETNGNIHVIFKATGSGLTLSANYFRDL